MKSTLLLFAVAVPIGLAGYLVGQNATSSPQESPALSVSPGENRPPGIEGVGYVEPRSEIRRLTFKAGGVIAVCRVEVGQHVQKGQLLAALANEDQTCAVRVAEQELELARAEEANVLKGIDAPQIEAARNRAAAWRHRVEFLEGQFTRNEALFADRKSISEVEYRRAAMDFHAAQAELGAAEAEVEHLTHFVRQEDKRLAQAKVALAQARLAQRKAELEDTVLLAPFDGTVLEILHREGEAVASEAREPVLLFADLSTLRVRAEIDERYVQHLRLGQEVVVHGRNLSDQTAQGRIAVLKQVMGPKTVFSRSASERKDLDIVQVLIDLDSTFQAPVGLRVDVTIAFSEPNTP
jgi:multidrug resistance efflux pump